MPLSPKPLLVGETPRKSLGPRGCLDSQWHRWDTVLPGWKTVPTGAFNLSSHTVLKLEARQAHTRVLLCPRYATLPLC